MARDDSIEQFPADIDRESFGHWLSGFCDGEACFYLGWHTPTRVGRLATPQASFSITLREDDADILRLIRSFFGCGRLHYLTQPRRRCCNYRITGARDCFSYVIPHFDEHQLITKKRHDFPIWKDAVVLMHEISKRAFVHTGIFGGGYHSKWSINEREHFTSLLAKLRTGRAFA